MSVATKRKVCIALWQPPTGPTRSQLLRSQLANVPPPPTKSFPELIWRAIPRMALQDPTRMRESLGPKANTSPVTGDLGARISITPNLSNFQGPVTSPGTITQLKGIVKGLRIKGHGAITCWAVHDLLGTLRLLKVSQELRPAYNVPNIKARLLSTTSML